MASYRVYWIDRLGRFRRGEWLDADSDEEAHRLASGLCDEHTDSIQIWRAERPVVEIGCHEED
jgi:hypothetical protein